jgi:hypothetical protein
MQNGMCVDAGCPHSRWMVARWSVPAHPEPVEGRASGGYKQQQHGKPVTTESLLGIGVLRRPPVIRATGEHS